MAFNRKRPKPNSLLAMDPASHLAASSEVMSPSGHFATPGMDHAQDGADLLPAMTASMLTGVSPPQPLPEHPLGPAMPTTAADGAATSEPVGVPKAETPAIPATAFEAALQTPHDPLVRQHAMGVNENRMREQVGAVAPTGVANDHRRNPMEAVTQQLEVVVQSGVQWFREAWRARPGPFSEPPPPPTFVTTSTATRLQAAPEGQGEGNPRHLFRYSQSPRHGMDQEYSDRSSRSFRHSSWKLWRVRVKGILLSMAQRRRQRLPAALLLAIFRRK